MGGGGSGGRSTQCLDNDKDNKGRNSNDGSNDDNSGNDNDKSTAPIGKGL